ncbi:hypothetical protein CO180_00110 [candidate division WWE3 bacterium CG_4_9_14_3_um_filter_41_6]|nr:MAG: hypothetical protein CO180_00110 [candidate division WWE3 bacterium CG_4_9_14_3_um_filter_41_6]
MVVQKNTPQTSEENITHTVRTGFTLIELLVVIAVIGILATVVLVAIDPQQRISEAKDVGRKSDLSEIANALEAYYTKNRAYPYDISQGGCGRYQTGGTPLSCDSVNDGDNWIPDLVSQGFLKSLPKDPINSTFSTVWANGRAYFYISENVGGGTRGDYYILGTWLENPTDSKSLGYYDGIGVDRPKWPLCDSTVGAGEIGFDSNIYVIRSYRCNGVDPEGSR